MVKTGLMPPPAGGSPLPSLKKRSSSLAAMALTLVSPCSLCCLRRAQNLPPAPLLQHSKSLPIPPPSPGRRNIYGISPALSKASLIWAAASASTSSSNICCLLPQRQHTMEAKGLGGESSRSSELSFMGMQRAHHPLLPTPPLPGSREWEPEEILLPVGS